MESDPIQRVRRALAIGVAFGVLLLVLAGLTRSRPTDKPAAPRPTNPPVSLIITGVPAPAPAQP